MLFDELLERANSIGRYQLFTFYVLRIAVFFTAWNTFSISFLGGLNEHWCSLETEQKLTKADGLSNISLDLLKDIFIPADTTNPKREGKPSQCLRYPLYERDNISGIINSFINGPELGSVVSVVNSTTATLRAQSEQVRASPLADRTPVSCESWQYGDGSFVSSWYMDWGVVCQYGYLNSINRSLYMGGYIIACIIFGPFSDNAGRRISFLTACFGSIVCNIAMCFSGYFGFIYFTVFRTLLAVFTLGIFTISYVIGIEMVGKEWRVFLMVTGGLTWTFGQLFLFPVIFFVREAFWLQVSLTIPQLSMLVLYFVTPESPRWLFARGRHSDGEKAMRRLAQINKRELPEKFTIVSEIDASNAHQDQSGSVPNQPHRGYTFADLLKTPNMRRKSMVLFINWFTASLIYYGISMNTNKLPGDKYINFLLLAAVEVPMRLSCWFLLSRVGRKLPIVIGLNFCGVFLLLTLLVPRHIGWLQVAFVLVGKWCAGTAFIFAYVYTGEIMPTVLRNTGVASCSLFARIAATCEPFIVLLGSYIPVVVFAFCCFLSGCSTILLPETRGRALPETLTDGERFGKADAFCSFTGGDDEQFNKLKPKPKTGGLHGHEIDSDNDEDDVEKLDHEAAMIINSSASLSYSYPS